MAFQKPLSADQSGAFFRHPVLGAIVWLFGAKKDEGGSAGEQLVDGNNVDGKVNLGQNNGKQRSQLHQSGADGMNGQHRARRSIIHAANANLGTSDYGSDHHNQTDHYGDSRESLSSSSSTGSVHGSGSNPSLYKSRRDSRRQSWSDESGQDLVSYFEGSTRRAKSPPSNPGEVKSAMKRSTSTMSKFSALELSTSPSTAAEASDVVGSLPKNYSPASQYFANPKERKGGGISPQWGWYISTTPPVEQFQKDSGSASPAEEAKIGKIGADIGCNERSGISKAMETKGR